MARLLRGRRLALALCLLAGLAAGAGPAAAQSAPAPGLTGDWGGLRSRLHADGVDLQLGYTSEPAWNFQGGDRETVRESGQLTLGATFDAEKLFGLSGGTFQASITKRRGQDLGAVAGLGTLQQVQEIYGRGQTWRLTQFWYQQTFAGSRADVKLGRVTVGEDFAAFSCDFMNLTFCGGQPGNIVGDYWYNWPVSQWGGRLRLKVADGYLQIGAYEVNPKNLNAAFNLGYLNGATGALIPLEAGWTPRLTQAALPGSYKLGGWYDTSRADDLLLDVNHALQALTGAAPLQRSGRYGAYLMVQQQLTGDAQDGKTLHGLSAFLNVSQADRRTARLDNQIAVGLLYNAPFRGRPGDVIGLALGRTSVNSRSDESLHLLDPTAPVPHAEYVTELYYSLQATPWLTVRPNLQYVVDPGGLRDRKDVGVFGVKAVLAL